MLALVLIVINDEYDELSFVLYDNDDMEVCMMFVALPREYRRRCYLLIVV